MDEQGDETSEEVNGKDNEGIESKTEEEKIPMAKAQSATHRSIVGEELEFDPTYQKRKRRKLLLIILGVIATLVLGFITYYNLVHVEVEDFRDKPVSEVRAWAATNDVQMELTEEYSSDIELNRIISQSIDEGKKIRKGKTITLVSSLGLDPEETIPLPDFSEMTQSDAEVWIAEHQAENLNLVSEYSDNVESGAFIKLVIRDSDIDEAEYRRKDSATVYYSRGEEVFEKNISVPDFSESTKEEVQQWADTNEIALTFEEKDSNTVEVGKVISQSIEAEEKIAKKDEMKVVLSLGKAVVVPNFGELTMDEAVSYPGLAVTVNQKFHSKLSYGKLIAQSIEADTKLIGDDDPSITVTYSVGQPFLADYRGMLEGDLPRLFYDDYQAKGANINYIVKYVDADEVKGTVVGMSKFNEFVSTEFTVEIRISNNTSAPTASTPIEYEEDEIDPPIEIEVPEEPKE
ncbi:serine/threonine-protein kinase [Natronobacillus azotifigens]|uniref:PASTA domain-containing protein n=1 Tax=Natronobacillus azotifigens TaxID=472978 RepID=A0A9J6RBJ4_9BACI|nr:PASTA domain-containing protein [Natronobacillus azotifigens]MCZ0703056.1 PASTA domain-containing protein [Natronobacillus azotifigens]